jgi:hypothetical protein
MESTRRLATVAAIGVAVIALAAASDFVVRSFWSRHAMLTSLIASLLVLAVTVVVLNEALERRERRRWSVLAQYVLFQLVQCARGTWMDLVELVTECEIDTASADGLVTAASLALDTEGFSAATRALLAEPQRREQLQELTVALAAHSREVISRWASVMVGSGPFTVVFDSHVELQGRLDWVSETLVHTEPTATRTPHHRRLARSSVAVQHTPALGDDWVHGQIVSLTQLAVALDEQSRALGFELVPMTWWVQRTQATTDASATPPRG